MDLATFQAVYEAVSIPVLLLGLGNVILIVLLAKWHVGDDPRFDFRRMLVDPATKAISSRQLGVFVALWTSTEWGMYLIVTGKFTEWFYAGYMAAWVAYGIANKYADVKAATANAKLPSHEDEGDPKP